MNLKVDKCLIPVKIVVLSSCKLPTAVRWKSPRALTLTRVDSFM